MDQISSIEHFLEAGDAAVSNEVAQQARHIIRRCCACNLSSRYRCRAPQAISSATTHCDTTLGTCR